MKVKVRCGNSVEVHIVGVISDYLTLCGLDGHDDSHYVDQENLGSTSEKVNCPQCIIIWKQVRKIKPSQISEEND